MEDKQGILIAIDGPAGSGKSSVAREIAARLGLVNLDTGATYRTVAMLALKDGVPPDDGDSLAALARKLELRGDTVFIEGVAVPSASLRTPEVSASASKVSSNAKLREALVEVQRRAAELARGEGGAVVEGRDVGTVVLPDAELKVYLSASSEERARRRAAQSGREGEFERIKAAIELRDRQDTQREVAPLRAHHDAVVVDTTSMSFEEVVAEVTALADSVRRRS